VSVLRAGFRALNGVLLLDKAKDVSSNRALQDARLCLGAQKAGYIGTLDPFATGLLPICFGEANKYSRWMLDADKVYKFRALLGQRSTTGDSEGTISYIDSSPHVESLKLRQAEQSFRGKITQIPPKFSALRVDGQRAYHLARKGKDFTLCRRQVVIHAIELSVDGNELLGRVRVSKGTYIRTLVEDIAKVLGTVAYCHSLRRCQVGHLVELNAHRAMLTMAQLREAASHDEHDKFLLPMDILCEQFPEQTILGGHWQQLKMGRKAIIDSPLSGLVRLYLEGVFCGLGEISMGQLKAFRLVKTS